MTDFFPVEATSPLFEGLDDVHVIFHGINKSGSLAMTEVLRRGLINAGRDQDLLSRYHHGLKRVPIPEFETMLAQKSGRFLVVGHYLYGALRPSPHRIWITQFRHPLPRIVSAYQWVKNKRLGLHGTTEGFPSLSEFVRASRGVNHSQVVQLGRGYGRFSKSRRKRRLSGEDLYELSVEAIEREFTAIGIAEYFEETIFCFAALLGIPAIDAWVADGRNPGRPLVDQLTASERELIHEIYRWDFALYEWALQRFAEQLRGVDFGPSLERYKAACSNQYKDRIVAGALV